MPAPTTDPVITIMNLVKNNWVPGNTLDITPDFHTGWWNPKSVSPQITFGNQSEGFLGGSGYGAIEGGGGGPVQIANGVVFANCWATRQDGQPNPKSIVYGFVREINRIIVANYNTDPSLNPLGVLGVDDVPPRQDATPLVFRKSITIGFTWRST